MAAKNGATSAPDSNIGQLGRRIEHVETNLGALSGEMAILKTDIRHISNSMASLSENIAKLSEAQGSAGRPNWGVLASWAGVILGLSMSIGALAIRPLSLQLDSQAAQLNSLNATIGSHLSDGHPSVLAERIEHARQLGELRHLMLIDRLNSTAAAPK